MKLNKLIHKDFINTLVKLTFAQMPAKSAFKLKGVVKKAEEELAKYEEVRKDALNRYGDKNEDGTLAVLNGNVLFSDSNLENFQKELHELQLIEIEIPSLSIDDLGDKVNLSVQDLLILDGIIC